MNVSSSDVRHESECESNVIVVDADVKVFGLVSIRGSDTDMDTTESPDIVEAHVRPAEHRRHDAQSTLSENE